MAALHYQQATAEWSKAIVAYLDDVISVAQGGAASVSTPRRR